MTVSSESARMRFVRAALTPGVVASSRSRIRDSRRVGTVVVVVVCCVFMQLVSVIGPILSRGVDVCTRQVAYAGNGFPGYQCASSWAVDMGPALPIDARLSRPSTHAFPGRR